MKVISKQEDRCCNKDIRSNSEIFTAKKHVARLERLVKACTIRFILMCQIWLS